MTKLQRLRCAKGTFGGIAQLTRTGWDGTFPKNWKVSPMQSPLAKILDQMRLHSQNEFEKGEYFERLVKVFLENDPLQGQAYDKVWLFKEWAQERSLPFNDTGIDLVARHADGSGFCAIQCKFYASDGSINKKHIDSFVSAASTRDFVSLIIVDTTIKNFSSNLGSVDNHRVAMSMAQRCQLAA